MMTHDSEYGFTRQHRIAILKLADVELTEDVALVTDTIEG